MEGNRVIKSLSSLFCFLELIYTVHMEVYMGHMPCLSVANDFCCLHDALIDVKAPFKTQFLSSLV
jgi:hypothetical protein